MTLAIVGGGIMGITLGYWLTRQNRQVEIFEASPVLGGLAGPLVLPDGTAVDRYYHTILSSDREIKSLCQELDLLDQMRFRETKMGFYHDDQIHSMNNIVEFLRFPPLGWVDRFRLGLTVLYAQFVRDWQQLESIDVEKWLVGLSGRNTFDNIWRPMLRAKFDGGFQNTPATYIWARLVRMKSTRQGANQKEMAGHVIGGYPTLISAMVRFIEANGGTIHLKRPIQEIVIADNAAKGLRLDGEVHPFEAVIVTTQLPLFRRLIPSANPDYLAYLGRTEYLGIICPLMVLDRPLTDYWTINITDERIPFTGVIETTSYIDPKYVGGHHLVYLPKYIAPASDWLAKSDEEIRNIWLDNLKQMFPGFDTRSIRYFLIHRERYVEPLHPLNGMHLIPSVKTPVEKLYLSTTSQIYPELTNGESVTRYAKAAAKIIQESLP